MPRNTKRSVIVKTSQAARLAPRQPTKPTKKKPAKTAPLRKRISKAEGLTARAIALAEKRTDAMIERAEEAAASGLLPHEWLLAVMRGTQLNHFAYDEESQEIVEIVVLPTFQDRLDAARDAAPYYAEKLTSGGIKGGRGKGVDPGKPSGVMEVPIATSMQAWVDIAGPSQAKLKRDVIK